MLSANPDSRAEFYLSTSDGIERKKRPAFLVKFLTRRELSRHGELVQAAKDADNPAECVRLLHEAVGIGCTNWRNVLDAEGKPRPFTREEMDNPDTGLTDMELWELAQCYVGVVQVSARDQVSFASPSVTPGA